MSGERFCGDAIPTFTIHLIPIQVSRVFVDRPSGVRVIRQQRTSSPLAGQSCEAKTVSTNNEGDNAMKSKFLGLLAVGLLAGPMAAHAR